MVFLDVVKPYTTDFFYFTSLHINYIGDCYDIFIGICICVLSAAPLYDM